MDWRSQWPRCLRRRSSAACPLRLWVRFPPGAWMIVCFECCVLSLRRIDRSSRGVLPTVVRRCVWSRNLQHEEAKTRCENSTTMGCNARKTKKQTNLVDYETVIFRFCVKAVWVNIQYTESCLFSTAFFLLQFLFPVLSPFNISKTYCYKILCGSDDDTSHFESFNIWNFFPFSRVLIFILKTEKWKKPKS